MKTNTTPLGDDLIAVAAGAAARAKSPTKAKGRSKASSSTSSARSASTAITISPDDWKLLRAVAFSRAQEGGGRASVSGVIAELIDQARAKLRAARKPPLSNGHREPEKQWSVMLPESVAKAVSLYAAERGWTKRMATLWAFKEAGFPVSEDEIVDARIAANQLDPVWHRGQKRPNAQWKRERREKRRARQERERAIIR